MTSGSNESPPKPTQELQEADLARLRQAVPLLPTPAFAVLDGAQWADIANELAGLGLRGRSLFLGAGEAVEAAGPWLMPLAQGPQTAAVLLDWLGAKPGAVFWGCEAGEAALWRHLRTLARVEMARVADSPDAAAAGSETVSFRYWDRGPCRVFCR